MILHMRNCPLEKGYNIIKIRTLKNDSDKSYHHSIVVRNKTIKKQNEYKQTPGAIKNTFTEQKKNSEMRQKETIRKKKCRNS